MERKLYYLITKTFNVYQILSVLHGKSFNFLQNCHPKATFLQKSHVSVLSSVVTIVAMHRSIDKPGTPSNPLVDSVSL